MKNLLVLCLLVVSPLAEMCVLGQGCLTITCSPDKTVQCGSAWVYDPPQIVNTGACTCGTAYTITVISSTTNSSATGPCSQRAQNVWQIVDCSGLAIFCVQNVNVVDTTPPVPTCALDKTVVCGTSWVFDTPTAVDACCTNAPIITILTTVTNAPITGCGYVASQIWDIQDCCGNATNCTQHVTILPGPPVFVCTNYSVPCGGPFPTPPVPPTVISPCCLTVNVSQIGTANAITPGCAGNITLVWQAVDCCANSTICTQLVTFTPSPPTLLCSKIAVECGNLVPTNPPAWLDFCCTNLLVAPVGGSITSTISGSCGYQISQTWTATNCCGGGSTVCTQDIFIVDTTPPTLTCAPDKTVQCGSGWVFDPPTATDICCGTNITYTFTTNIITTPLICQTIWEGVWTATDCCGNSSVCTQAVTEIDTIPPVVACASNKTVQCGTSWTFDPPTGSDACCGTNLTFSLLTPVLLSSTPCQKVWAGPWQVGDCCNNYVICTQIVTEVDTVAPVLSCINKTVQCGTAWSFDQPGAIDCCPNLTYLLLSSNLVSGSTCSSVWAGGWQVTDCCSNSSVCTQLVSIVDTTPPTITCPPNVTVPQGTPWNFGQPTATDVCCGTNLTITTLSTVTNPLCPPVVTRTWQATDCCGNNSAPCSQTVTVQCNNPPPSNDLCANAYTVPVGTWCGTTICATPSTGIPTPCGNSANSPDVWFRFVPVCTGPVAVDTCGVCPGFGTFDTVLSVYTGPCNALSQIACNNNSCGLQSVITYNGIAGTSYYIRISGPNCATGRFRLNIAAGSAPPPNDLCQNAIPVQVGSPAACGTTICATPSTPGTIPVPCGYSLASPDVWYTWTPTCSGTATIDTCGLCVGQTATFDTVLSVYTGSCNALFPIGCSDDSLVAGCYYQSRVSFLATPGITYIIRVAGFDTTVAGTFRLNIAQTLTPPFNDPCANAITLSSSGIAMFNTCGATTDGPTQPGCQPGSDVWYKYIAPCSGQVWVDTCLANFNTVLSVYSGNCGALNLLACNDDAAGGPCIGSQGSFLTFNAVGGTTYTIRIGGFNNAQGWGLLRVQGPYPTVPTCPPSSGLFFCRAFLVTGTANNTPWAWSIREPCCFNFGASSVPGLPVGSSASQLAQAFVNSINASCTGGGIFAIAPPSPPGMFVVCLTSCGGASTPWTFSVGPAGTAVSNQCVVANFLTPGWPPVPLATAGPCSFNPIIEELPYANSDVNTNGVDDAVDIMFGASADLNMNGIPDEAESCQAPIVSQKPESRVVELGNAVTLSITASGTEPLSYQWSFNGAPLAGATASTLTRAPITSAHLGDYAVTVTNACGSSQVSPITLSVEAARAPTITGVAYVNGTAQITFGTEEGRTYVVEFNNDLSPTGWSPATTVHGDGLDQIIEDRPPLPMSRFYRIRLVLP